MIINLTQHQATQEQFEAGVVEPANKKLIQELLTSRKSRDRMNSRRRLWPWQA